jgi:hypothetical protein
MKVFLVLALAAATQGAAISSPLDLVNNLQEMLLNPDRMKRSASDEWDKEFDLSALGLRFAVKYTDLANPLKGGHAHVTFPGRKFYTGVNFDDVELDIHFNGGDHFDGLFDMKVDYKFVQKFTFMADKPQSGSVMIYRKLEGGMWKTKIAVDSLNHSPNPFLDITVDSDMATKLYSTFKYDNDNLWAMNIDYTPGSSITGVVTINGIEYKMVGTLDMAAKSITGVATINGVEYTLACTLDMASKKIHLKLTNFPHGKTHTLDIKMNNIDEYGLFVTGDVHGPVDIKFVTKDFKRMDLVVKHNNKNYAFIKFTGDTVIDGMVPKKMDYIMKYNIMDSMVEGKAKVNFDAQTPIKTMHVSFVPKTGKNMNVDFKWEGNLISATHKFANFDFESTIDGITYTKFHHESDLKNDDNIFTIENKNEITMDPKSTFYNFFCSMVGQCFTNGMRETKVMYNKKETNILGKMMFKDVTIVDGVKVQEKNIDTTTSPYVMTWYKPFGKYSTNEIFGLEQVEVKAWHKVNEELVVETNIGDMKLTVRKFPAFVEFIKDGETRFKSQTEITPALFSSNTETVLYIPHGCFSHYGCFTKKEGHVKVVYERVNKNTLFNKFMIEFSSVTDNDQVLNMKVDTMVSPYTVNIHAPYIIPKIFNDVSRHNIDATINHQVGKMLEIESNCPEIKNFKYLVNGTKRTVVLNGQELTMLTMGTKKISQTMVLPSGEKMTTTVEWTKNTMKINKALVTIAIDRENPKQFMGTFEWDFQTMANGSLMFDIKGRDPVIGSYKVNRSINWSVAAPQYVFNSVGKSEFTYGFMAFFPIDSDIKLKFDTRSMMLNADLMEIVGKQKYGVKVAKNKFSLITGMVA